MTTIALADDHLLIRNALVELINRFPGFKVIFDTSNGKEFIDGIQSFGPPDIALIDINMPVMDGFETTEYLARQFPDIKCVALSVEDNEESIIKMLRLGAKGYLLKDTDTSQFILALSEIRDKGYYHSDLVSNTLLKSLHKPAEVKNKIQSQFQAREEEFIKLACTEMTYKEIADQMCLSPRTIDGYRESLFLKLEVKSRVGLVLFAIKNNLVNIH
ncbi:MAG: response regulator transcription factor [Cytophagaceae bacterium]|nr:response regulator transcription factor [Cytophagaceae bacterium]MBK9935212.1 response regulator transcription factor [Cytophagaceae bacterium]MBL0301655.1 response regulator transcription factor [Cytophagaceae bacterium]MBL0324480.1 response regulator transcription factor [Cytophagaceae bacterium]